MRGWMWMRFSCCFTFCLQDLWALLSKSAEVPQSYQRVSLLACISALAIPQNEKLHATVLNNMYVSLSLTWTLLSICVYLCCRRTRNGTPTYIV